MALTAANSPSLYAVGRGGVHPALAAAQAWCQNYARQHAENFTFASWLLPRALRPHFACLYAWCRWADDLADASGNASANLALLNDWELQLHECAAGEATHPIYVALVETLRVFAIPLEHFTNLLSAFRQDQSQTRYETFDELLDYCQRSANPVGRMVLCVGRCDSVETRSLSDAVCTGLQLINFWQDIQLDWVERRRIYLPRQTLQKYKATEQSIREGRATREICAAIAWEVERAEQFLRSGWPLVERVSPELRVEVELFIRAGLSVAAAIRRQGFDVLTARPTIGKVKKFQMFTATLVRRSFVPRRGVPA
jgi:squalene synthase HpnC